MESPYRKLAGIGRLNRRIPQEIEEEMTRALKLVRIPDPERILDRYPFELSGGMRQRVMIAMALSENPKLLIADEPTTALDVTTQAQVLRLMMELVNEVNTSLLIITHDLGVAAQIAERVLVMYAGVIVEDAAVNELFANPRHPYTKALLTCLPKASKKVGKLGAIPGSVLDLRQDIKWCPFIERCPYAMKRCKEEHPQLEGDVNRVACFLYS
jgi:oligopeptide/dipeptide ABC transporter ATP-binding protein